jgi:hypothetical protein
MTGPRGHDGTRPRIASVCDSAEIAWDARTTETGLFCSLTLSSTGSDGAQDSASSVRPSASARVGAAFTNNRDLYPPAAGISDASWSGPHSRTIGIWIPPAAGGPESEEPAAGCSHEHPVRDPEPRVDLLVTRFLPPSAVRGRARPTMTLAERPTANH